MIKKIQEGRTDLVFDILKNGGEARVADENGVSLIKWCAYHGDVSAIRFLLEKGEKLSSLGENFDLNGAVFHGHWQLCQFLIEQGADANFPMPDTGETPLHAALCLGKNHESYERIVRILLDAGANPNAATKKSAPTGAFMRDCKTKAETPLHRAAAYGSEKVIEMLIGAGAVIDAQDMHGDTPLSWASWHLRPRSVLKKLCYGPFKVAII